jgi:hypothetical protein
MDALALFDLAGLRQFAALLVHPAVGEFVFDRVRGYRPLALNPFEARQQDSNSFTFRAGRSGRSPNSSGNGKGSSLWTLLLSFMAVSALDYHVMGAYNNCIFWRCITCVLH